MKITAGVRNEALYPIMHPAEYGHFQKVLFINDIYFCADDLRELIYQSLRQQSDVTCATDFDVAEPPENPQLGFYDTWVARDVNGEAFNKFPHDGFTKDPLSTLHLGAGLPFQVSCCWYVIMKIIHVSCSLKVSRYFKKGTAWSC